MLLEKIRAIFTAQPARRTNQIWIWTPGSGDYRTSWFCSNGSESTGHPSSRTILPERVWPSYGEDQGWSVGFGPTSREKSDHRRIGGGNITEKLTDAAPFTSSKILLFLRETLNGRRKKNRHSLISYSLRSSQSEESAWSISNWKTQVAGYLHNSNYAPGEIHKRNPRCWQLRSVAKSITRCYPARLPWPREYHAVCLASRTRGTPWKCSRKR